MGRRLAYIGWGSLVWNPRDLPIVGSWRRDGPELPVEFARVSRDGRLTLVLWDDAAPVRTYWARSEIEDIDEAHFALAFREDARPTHIHATWPEDTSGGPIEALIREWLVANDLGGAIWTGLPATFEAVFEKPFSAEAAVEYLETLEGEVLARAEEYVRKAPPQTKTSVRDHIERELGWTSVEPPPGAIEP